MGNKKNLTPATDSTSQTLEKLEQSFHSEERRKKLRNKHSNSGNFFSILRSIIKRTWQKKANFNSW